jgi:hypothetical protein
MNIYAVPMDVLFFLFPLYFVYKYGLYWKVWLKLSITVRVIAATFFVPTFIFFRLIYIALLFYIPLLVSDIYRFPNDVVRLVFLIIDGLYWFLIGNVKRFTEMPFSLSFFTLFIFEFLVVFPILILLALAAVSILNY